MDIDIGRCSCTKGCTGAACKHQATVIKKHQISCCNTPPIFSKEERRRYAILALGKAMDITFYTDLTDTTPQQTEHPKDPITPDSSMQLTPSSSCDETMEEHICTSEPDCPNPANAEDLWQDQLQSFRSSLSDVVDDLVSRLHDGNHNLVSGVTKFLSTYKKIVTSSVAPSSTLTQAFHSFGKVDSKFTRR